MYSSRHALHCYNRNCTVHTAGGGLNCPSAHQRPTRLGDFPSRYPSPTETVAVLPASASATPCLDKQLQMQMCIRQHVQQLTEIQGQVQASALSRPALSVVRERLAPDRNGRSQQKKSLDPPPQTRRSKIHKVVTTNLSRKISLPIRENAVFVIAIYYAPMGQTSHSYNPLPPSLRFEER